ncbi:phosphohistidine phosphatase SixA [Thermoproteus tenax]|uniref:Phosphohistidine phosphatase SixA n=1 Tax=Thermoproteus tenax (strain ATCC 35583 / DSM 2078 / JCM 9277 / NBRC 100435 / Kra 1) TaxID=768679 RepID=G4RN69_THETK|nr:phosphohistidine phosphatase SixA [Thermoproteus tenax]CCC81013.1 Phosphohistidine phosphatase SixA [Thermoproteus tenax Kra 1]
MPLVCLVQHGKSYPEAVDPERSLTPEGAEEARRVAAALARAGVRIAAIYHSGKKRARQTAEIFAEALRPAKVEEAQGLSPNDDPAPWAQRINAMAEDAMIVGHLPHLARLAALLLGADVVEFRYSAALCLAGPPWRIKWYLTPELA